MSFTTIFIPGVLISTPMKDLLICLISFPAPPFPAQLYTVHHRSFLLNHATGRVMPKEFLGINLKHARDSSLFNVSYITMRIVSEKCDIPGGFALQIQDPLDVTDTEDLSVITSSSNPRDSEWLESAQKSLLPGTVISLYLPFRTKRRTNALILEDGLAFFAHEALEPEHVTGYHFLGTPPQMSKKKRKLRRKDDAVLRKDPKVSVYVIPQYLRQLNQALYTDTGVTISNGQDKLDPEEKPLPSYETICRETEPYVASIESIEKPNIPEFFVKLKDILNASSADINRIQGKHVIGVIWAWYFETLNRQNPTVTICLVDPSLVEDFDFKCPRVLSYLEVQIPGDLRGKKLERGDLFVSRGMTYTSVPRRGKGDLSTNIMIGEAALAEPELASISEEYSRWWRTVMVRKILQSPYPLPYSTLDNCDFGDGTCTDIAVSLLKCFKLENPGASKRPAMMLEVTDWESSAGMALFNSKPEKQTGFALVSNMDTHILKGSQLHSMSIAIWDVHPAFDIPQEWNQTGIGFPVIRIRDMQIQHDRGKRTGILGPKTFRKNANSCIFAGSKEDNDRLNRKREAFQNQHLRSMS